MTQWQINYLCILWEQVGQQAEQAGRERGRNSAHITWNTYWRSDPSRISFSFHSKYLRIGQPLDMQIRSYLPFTVLSISKCFKRIYFLWHYMFQEHICKSLEYNYCHYLKLLTWPKNAVMTILSVSYRLDNEGLRHSIILDICDLSSSATHLKHKQASIVLQMQQVSLFIWQ